MAIEYLDLSDALIIHLRLMQRHGEVHYGIYSRHLIESALARPQQSYVYESADIVRQAASLYFGLIKNHPWLGGNKRTATAIVDEFLYRNRLEIKAEISDVVKLVLAIESDRCSVDEIEQWLRTRVARFG